MRKTKIICTLGPATDKDGVLETLIKEGMDVARFNFSHGDHETHRQRLEKLKELRHKLHKPVAAMLDTKGPEVRVCSFKNGKVEVKRGDEFTLTTRKVDGDEHIVQITFADLPKDVSVGTTILIDDGLIELKVLEITDTDIKCEVINGGVISNSKGVNVPNVDLSMPYLSDRDKSDLLFGIEQGFDFIAASFVRTAGDILQIRRFLEEHNCYSINIIAKIENSQGVDHIDEIIQVSDGIMVARGDMGVEIPCEEVPVIQKMIINKVYMAGKQVITATQMLDSMIKNPRPTRAETTDVANAIYDGTSAVMLSGESAAGKYPVEAVEMMAKIAERAEAAIDYKKNFYHYERAANQNVTDAVCHAACTTAIDLNAAAVIIVTKSGVSARNISKYRPSCNIIAGTTSDKAYRQLNMSWGVTPVHLEEQNEVFTLFDHAVAAGKKQGLLQAGDKVVIGAGVPLGISGNTNMLKVQVVE